MKSGIFYLSSNPAPDRQQLVVADGVMMYVRVEVVADVSPLEALDRAKPRLDEDVMNSHWIEGEEM